MLQFSVRWLVLGVLAAAVGASACGRSPLDGVIRSDGIGGRDAASMATSSDDDGGVDVPDQHCRPPAPADDVSRATTWSFDFGDAALQRGELVAFDGDGNVYLEGAFAGTVELGGQALTAVGMDDHFVAKLDARGALLWSKSFRGTFAVGGMKVTPQGSLVLAGTLDGRQDFGAGPQGSPSSHGLYVVVFDACGDEVRGTLLPTSPATSAAVSSLDVDADGSAVVAGSFDGSIDLGEGPIESGGAGEPESFVAKLAADGTYVWGRRLGLDVSFVVVAADAAGDTFVAGRLSGTVNLGGPPLTAQGAIVVMKLDGAGAPLWSHLETVGDAAAADPASAAVDTDGNLLLAGGFTYGHNPGGKPGEFTLDFGGGIAADYVCCGDDAFVASLAPSGQPRWIHGFGGESGAALVATNAGHTLVVSGQGDDTFNVQVLGPAGTPTGSTLIEGEAASVFGFDVDSAGRVVVTGSFTQSLSVGQSPKLVTGPGLDLDGFVAKLAP
jgi:hypothetical protein